MSVATQLGLHDPDNMLALACTRWPSWQRRHHHLQVVDDLLELPGWLRRSGPEDADQVLLALAQLSSPEGDDDVAATGALAWLLLPGISVLAGRLATLTPLIDQMLAAALWVEARTFPWQRGHRVAANILMNARKSVLRDLGVGCSAGPVWARSTPVDWAEEAWGELGAIDAEEPAEQELSELFEWACTVGVINDGDRALLVEVAHTADRHHTTRAGRGHAGLLANSVSAEVAARRGVSAITIRRHTSRSVQALREALQEARKVPA